MTPDIQLIIDRLKSHPDDFFEAIDNPISAHIRSPRLEYLERMMRREFAPRREEKVAHTDATKDFWFLTDDEREALRAAYTEAIRERFTAGVLFNIMRPDTDVELETVKYRTQGRYTTNLANSMTATANTVSGLIHSGFTDPRGVFGSAPIKAEGASTINLDSSGGIISAAQTAYTNYGDSNGNGT